MNKVYVTAIFKKDKKQDLGSEASQPHLYPRKKMEQINMETFPKILTTKKVTRSSQRRYTMAKSCLTNLTAFYDYLTSLVDKERTVNDIYLDCRKAFDTVFHNIITDREDEVQPV